MCCGTKRLLFPRRANQEEERIMARATAPGARMEETGERVAGAHDETKWAPLTTEFWAMLLLIIAILIAAAISDSLNDIRAWTLVAIIGAAYILSRGFA